MLMILVNEVFYPAANMEEKKKGNSFLLLLLFVCIIFWKTKKLGYI